MVRRRRSRQEICKTRELRANLLCGQAPKVIPRTTRVFEEYFITGIPFINHCEYCVQYEILGKYKIASSKLTIP